MNYHFIHFLPKLTKGEMEERRVREGQGEERGHRNNQTAHMQTLLTPTTKPLDAPAGATSPIWQMEEMRPWELKWFAAGSPSQRVGKVTPLRPSDSKSSAISR